MTFHTHDIGPWQLGLGLIFVLMAAGTSFAKSLGLERDIAIGTVRTFAQLFLMGFVLSFLFAHQSIGFVLGLFIIMVIFAARIVKGRVKEKDVSFTMPVFWSMFLGYALVAVMVTGLVVQAKPWWRAEYFIPLGGMVVGNSMTALAICLERFFSDIRTKRDIIEMKLALGASMAEASDDIVRDALRSGMIPSINSMMGVGVVFIPGMMSGQILAGADPMIAIRYQIVVMLMLVGSCALTCILVIHLIRRRTFGKGQYLCLRP
ncbi:ABC transporter permease [Desulfovibrio inopinatus]|uniref:ABC transporter permease n=1 Tax=Desulfovibrio inopinatus TaxID=102109 RepID=UPI000411CE0E|nr:iron export ABC transporter permease subunit FetB [Desulfovibrio inopinatus]